MRVTNIPNFEQLTDLERLESAEALAASIRNPEALPAPLAHRLELEKRWSHYERDPSVALSPGRGGQRFEVAFRRALDQVDAGFITHARVFEHFHRVDLPSFPFYGVKSTINVA